MSINKYQAFVTTVEQRSITRAASKLGYTQAGISHLISALESDLGVPLLIRSKTGTALTPEGADLLPYVQRLLSMNEDIRNKALDLRGLTAGSLRIGTFSSVAIHLLPQILSQFRNRYPGVEVSILNGDYAAVESALLGNTVDCGFVTLPSREEFTVIPLIRDRLMAVVDADSPLVQAPELDPADLQNDTFIIPAEGSNYNIGKLFAQAGITPRKWLNINDDYAAVVMVRRKLGDHNSAGADGSQSSHAGSSRHSPAWLRAADRLCHPPQQIPLPCRPGVYGSRPPVIGALLIRRTAEMRQPPKNTNHPNPSSKQKLGFG